MGSWALLECPILGSPWGLRRLQFEGPGLHHMPDAAAPDAVAAIDAYRGVALAIPPCTHPEPRVDILPTTEEASEKRHAIRSAPRATREGIAGCLKASGIKCSVGPGPCALE